MGMAHHPGHMHSGYRGRFAPSPTGPLHFGSLIAAVASYLDARRHHGHWLVRIDDLDTQRSDVDISAGILRDLESYGMYWDEEVVYQSARTALYRDALRTLEDRKAVFGCACSRKSIPGGIYPGTCRNGIPIGKLARSVRMRTERTPVSLTDVVLGPYAQNLEKEVGDFVIRRADGMIAYHLATVYDDAHQGITHVVRGADLLASTPRQIYLQRHLDLPTPSYAHLPVALGAQGEKLSKQTHAAPIRVMAKEPTLHAALTFLGQHPPAALRKQAIDEQWSWACEHWQLERVPKVIGQFAPLND